MQKKNKKLVIDNATGPLDRIVIPIKGEAPIEIISAHHTKPWGVGKCGLILCTADQEPLSTRPEVVANPAIAANLPVVANLSYHSCFH